MLSLLYKGLFQINEEKKKGRLHTESVQVGKPGVTR